MQWVAPDDRRIRVNALHLEAHQGACMAAELDADEVDGLAHSPVLFGIATLPGRRNRAAFREAASRSGGSGRKLIESRQGGRSSFGRIKAADDDTTTDWPLFDQAGSRMIKCPRQNPTQAG